MTDQYDIIGDIHGHAGELMELLEKLGYDRSGGYYAHPSRQVLFAGDFIDRGPRIGEVLAVVRPMVENNSARAVMGNHEFNALAYHTPHPQRPGEFLRPHNEKNVRQHSQTVKQLSTSELEEALAWFRTLPMWLDLGKLRIVHACWDEHHIGVLKQALSEYEEVTTSFLVAAMNKETTLYHATEAVLKGKEMILPEGMLYEDKDGVKRSTQRVRWFESPQGKTIRTYGFPVSSAMPDKPLPEAVLHAARPYAETEPPVFVGHYWLRGTPAALAPNVACVDYSVGKGGALAAYRFDGEQTLSNEKFICIPACGGMEG